MTKFLYRVKYILSYDVLAEDWNEALDEGRKSVFVTLETFGIDNPGEVIYVFDESLEKLSKLTREQLELLQITDS